MSVKGDVKGLLKVLRTWPDGCTFDRLKLPVECQDRWVMNDLVRQGFLVDLGDNLYQRTTRKYAYHKRKPPRKRTLKTTLIGGHFMTVSPFGRKQPTINDPVRTAEMFEMRAGQNGEPPASYQDIANHFNISRQRVNQILKKNGVEGRVLGKDPNFLTTTQAATYLSASYRSIRDWAVTGTLPYYQKRGTKFTRFLFRKEDLATFKQEKLLIGKRTHKENQGLKPLVIRLLELGDNPQKLAKLSGVGITTVYQWMYAMPGRDKRVGVAMEKILSTGGESNIPEKLTLANLANLATGE